MHARYPVLPFIIIRDIFYNNKFILLLLILVLISAELVIFITYKTRFMISYEEELKTELNILKTEWRNLLSKKSALENYERLEQIAINKLKMKYVNYSQEHYVVNS